MYYEISRPDDLMLIEDAALAIVEINPPETNAAPTISGKVYVSDGWSALVLTIKFWFPAESETVTRFTLIVAEAPL
tara:strand:- start:2416 stop:2643 length:228 start_codon:yes stop_codon:yes gene_type:complete